LVVQSLSRDRTERQNLLCFMPVNVVSILTKPNFHCGNLNSFIYVLHDE